MMKEAKNEKITYIHFAWNYNDLKIDENIYFSSK